MTSNRHLALMALMNEIEAPAKTYRHAVNRAAQTETDSPANLAAIERGNAALDDIETAVRRWVAAHPAEEPVTAMPARRLTDSEYNSAWHAVEGAAGEEGADPGTVLHAVLDRLRIGWQDAEETHVVADDSSDPAHVDEEA